MKGMALLDKLFYVSPLIIERRKMKKIYMMPSIVTMTIHTESVMAAQSVLDPNKDSQEITPGGDPYDGEFGSKRGGRTANEIHGNTLQKKQIIKL